MVLVVIISNSPVSIWVCTFIVGVGSYFTSSGTFEILSMLCNFMCFNFLRYCTYQPHWLPYCPIKSLLHIASPPHSPLSFPLPMRHLPHFFCAESKGLWALCFSITLGERSWGGVLQKWRECLLSSSLWVPPQGGCPGKAEVFVLI